MKPLFAARVLGALLLVSAGAHAACPFNVSGVGTLTDPASFDLLRDGVLITRYAQGMRGAALVAGTGTTAATVESNIANNLAQLDINGDGFLDVQDALVINRALLGIANSKQGAGTANVNYGTRTNAAVMQAFVAGGCNITFAAPSSDQVDASRFLIQSTFGPSLNDIQSFVALTPDAAVSGSNHKKQRSTWLNNQLNMARSQKHFDYLLARKVEYDAAGQTFYSEMSRETFWGQALKSPDQLRQRVAFALSEVVVVSENGGSNDPFELAAYLDLLADNSFGNFRDILYKVSLSPAMGRYLSHLRNDGGAATPNENFAREILQLFAVGLFMLNADGTATATPSYDEDTVKGFAKVFTGFTFDDPYCKTGDPGYGISRTNCRDGYSTLHPSWYWSPYDNPPNNTTTGEAFPPVLAGWAKPMIAYPGKHSALAKQMLKYNYASPVSACTAAVNLAKPAAAGGADGLLAAINTTGSGVTTGTRVNATQAYATLNSAIDNVFCHPNVGPFISRHLIKFLVTSTPTPAYVQRVAAVFNDNGSGVRGDMKAVIRAILLDDEAVSPATTLTATEYAKFGKLKEPMLRLSAILRAFNGTSASGRYQLHYINDVEYGISQGPLQSPTVFNYFHPEFAPPGPVSTNGAIAPEFEITTTTAVASTQNFLGSVITSSNGNNLYKQNGQGDFSGTCDSTNTQDCIFSNLSDLYAIQASSSSLFDYINLVLLGGTLSPTNKAALASALDTAYPVYTLPGSPTAGNITTWQDRKRDRVKSALWLAVHTPEFQIQR
ncbi:DUF1800 family protein [Casimicrobium huifangae]|uniref:DUF1800 family protein n=1 Tax=Casimicrobium huifangae TaxID=2591109 RepID=UPI0037851FDC